MEVVRMFQARLRQRYPGLTARLLRRPNVHEDVQTWMEIYAFGAGASPAGVTAALEADISAEATVLTPFIMGERHSEEFVPCVS